MTYAPANLSSVLCIALVLGSACTFDATGLGEDQSASAGTSSSGSTGETTTTTTTASTTAATTTAGTTVDPTTTTTTNPTTTTVTTTTGPGVCGDGAVDPGEECDNGEANADSASCKSDCTNNVCGDGALGPGEGCDDGNTADGDGCSAICVSETCGDGVMSGVEQCDDGDMIDDNGCTNACTLPACGDGIVQEGAGEECDEGADNGPTKECTASCQKNVCGDGGQGPGEECDDGNDVNNDACVSGCKDAGCGDGFTQSGVEQCDDKNNSNNDACVACQDATCGDGFVRFGVEQCDDKNVVDDDDCTNACKVNGTYVFLSSTDYKGNLGGVAGADAKCDGLAKGKGFSGTWKAWISDGATDPSQSFVKSTKGYFLLNGTKIANDWTDLITPPLLAQINVNENFMIQGGTTGVWTGTTPAGVSQGTNCMNWGSSNQNQNGEIGRRDQVDGRWTAAELSMCSSDRRLYCFQQ